MAGKQKVNMDGKCKISRLCRCPCNIMLTVRLGFAFRLFCMPPVVAVSVQGGV